MTHGSTEQQVIECSRPTESLGVWNWQLNLRCSHSHV